MTPIKISLYTTSHCHLCEQAEALLLNFQNQINYLKIEISDNNLLMDAYGMKIPVLKRLDNDIELAWPFTNNDIEKFLLA